MKNIILGIVGVFITIYTMLMGLNILTIQSHKDQLENHLSRIVKNVLEAEYGNRDEDAVKQMLQEEIQNSVSENAKIFVEIQEIDLQKGILSVKVTEEIHTLTDSQREIVVQKTAIMDRVATEPSKVTVTFLVEEEVYKEYQIVKGKSCPLPKEPEGGFLGWREYGTETIVSTEHLKDIWENRVYEAVFH